MDVKNVITEQYAIYQGDCIDIMKQMKDESIHMSIYSPPFGGLYNYSSDVRDLSNADNYEDFFEHYKYVVKEKFRITLPGRISAVHCADIPNGNTGHDNLIDFPGDLIRLHEKEGWKYIARHCIWKEPLGVRNRTMAKSLAHKTIVDDSTLCSNAGADFLLIFRRKGENRIPVIHPTGIKYYAGDREMPTELIKYKNYSGKQTENRYSHWIWRQYASSFWDDIRIGNVLPFKPGKDDKDEKHVHPLQLDIIDRCCELYTNKGEKVLTPFAGIMSEVFSAVSYGRKGIGIELKKSYFDQGVKNMRDVKNRFINGQFEIYN